MSFEDREKSFEKKFAHEEEIQFKVNARRNKYLGEWAASKLKKNDDSKQAYIEEVIKSDFSEPGEEDVFKKVKQDFIKANIEIQDSEIRDQMKNLLDKAKKNFL